MLRIQTIGRGLINQLYTIFSSWNTQFLSNTYFTIQLIFFDIKGKGILLPNKEDLRLFLSLQMHKSKT